MPVIGREVAAVAPERRVEVPVGDVEWRLVELGFRHKRDEYGESPGPNLRASRSVEFVNLSVDTGRVDPRPRRVGGQTGQLTAPLCVVRDGTAAGAIGTSEVRVP